jgi:hypothetical protein
MRSRSSGGRRKMEGSMEGCIPGLLGLNSVYFVILGLMGGLVVVFERIIGAHWLCTCRCRRCICMFMLPGREECC